MLELYCGVVGSRILHVQVTERADGDQRPDRGTRPETLAAQHAVAGRPWTMAAEEHGIEVVEAAAPAAYEANVRQSLLPGDVLVTEQTDVPLAVWAGDCAPLVLCGAKGTLVAVHAGWRGLALGVVDVGIGELTRRDDHVERAILGPSIHAECYEFGLADLGAVAAGVGTAVDEIARTQPGGATALDVPRAVALALRRRGIGLDVTGACTSCDDRWYSHRGRSEAERHAMVAWTTAA